MRTLLQKFFRHMGRRGETGQSIILLAIGFIALAGFVGITVDVSLMFVRFAQLSRAVDSAAIAAANQMRQDKSLATVGLAARQFIEFHGLSPESVWVDTCLTQPNDVELCTAEQSKLVRVRAFVKVPTVFMRLLGIQSFDLVAAAVSQTAALDVVIIMDVSESMASDTTYLDWAKVYEIGSSPDPRTWTEKNWGVVYRPPRAFDILLRKTSNNVAQALENEQRWWEAGKDAANQAVLTNGGVPTAVKIDGLLRAPQIHVNDRLVYRRAGDNVAGPLEYPGNRDTDYIVTYNDNFFNDTNFPPATYPGPEYDFVSPVNHPRESCRVRFYPNALNVSPTRYGAYIDNTGAIVNMGKLLVGAPSPAGFTGWGGTQTAPATFDGFVPTYSFYDCCNDPDADGFFEDVTCQPFKQARDATLQFIQRIDFVRGDRAAFVTFDRSAFLINPFGYENATAKLNGDESKRPGAMLDSWDAAFATLRDLVGVRAEPNFYVYNPGSSSGLTSRWGDPGAGIKLAAGIKPDGTSQPINYASSSYTPLAASQPEAYNYPVFDNCEFQNAGLEPKVTLFDYGLHNIAIPNNRGKPPNSSAPALPGMGGYSDDGRGTGWAAFSSAHNPSAIPLYTGAPANPGSYNLDMAYESWASCRSGNVGAALREANNALLNPRTVRRFGTVWVMVMLSDGAAGGSDPVRRNAYKIPTPRPYQLVTDRSAAGYDYVPAGTVFDPLVHDTYGAPGDYGALGLCPMGNPNGYSAGIVSTDPGELIAIGNDSSGGGARFPYCSDEQPRTRYTCDFRPLRTLANYPNTNDQKKQAMRDRAYLIAGSAGGPPANFTGEQVDTWNRLRGNMYDVDIDMSDAGDGWGGCNPLYDVDDYAHDWADFIGLQNLAGSGTAQLPTIFTIGFGLGYTNYTRSDGIDVRTLTDTTVNPPKPGNPAQPLSHTDNQRLAQQYATDLCAKNVSNCQGEQLLRYIADIGDNNKIDNDYWQDAMQEWYNFSTSTPGMRLSLNGNVQPGGVIPPQSFDRRDPCQTPNSATVGPVGETYDENNNAVLDPAEAEEEWGALGPNRSCGNYYYAPDGNELQFVFNDIASRMFTRLSR